MKIAIFEAISTPGGHEGDFDRILVEELAALGHEVVFCVPQNFCFPMQYHTPVIELQGTGVSYTGLRGIAKWWAAAKREARRQNWYRQLYKLASEGAFDALIVPTSTYRYLRALGFNRLKRSSVPVVFILHGINAGEAAKFYRAADNLDRYSNIKMAVLTFGDDVLGRTFPQVYCIAPPTFIPRDVAEVEPEALNGRPLRLGFFGQYRREKKLDAFLEAFLAHEYRYPVELVVQGATMKPEDSEDFERIIEKYKNDGRVRFVHKGLWGAQWQQAIQGIDALLMPYGAKRYLYHWAGMLFTAIGYRKPVVASNEINPEVLDRYKIGLTFDSQTPGDLTRVLREFIDTYPESEGEYAAQLEHAWREYHPRRFAEKIARLCEK